MLDSDLAELYGVETRRLNEQVTRNPDGFPDDFMFRLNESEFESLISQIATSKRGGRRKLPYVYRAWRIDAFKCFEQQAGHPG